MNDNSLLGYFVSIIIDRKLVSLAATGLSLLWSVALAGAMAPNIKDLQLSDYDGVRWIFSLSPTRWFVERYYINEVSARPWKELSDGTPMHNGYDYANRTTAFNNVVIIGLAWLFLSLVALKLVNRKKQK